MGAEEFETTGIGDTAGKAFSNAVGEARYEYGHGGYTGTIAEKSDFVEATYTNGNEDVWDLVEYIKDAAGGDIAAVPTQYRDWAAKYARYYDDKWGPAVCLHIKDNQYLFIGWASS
jgi:hypothetical protein